jgi:hypothetical protein
MLKAIGFALLAVWSVASPAEGQWSPSGLLAGVPVSEDCDRSAGAPAYAAEGPQIFTCESAVAAIEAAVTNAAHFFLVHEYGRIAVEGANDAEADCWAAHEIGATADGTTYIDATARWFEAQAEGLEERALRIRECSGLPFEPPPTGDRCCTEVGSCELPGEDASLAIGRGCYCGSEVEEGDLQPGEVCASEPGEAQP